VKVLNKSIKDHQNDVYKLSIELQKAKNEMNNELIKEKDLKIESLKRKKREKMQIIRDTELKLMEENQGFMVAKDRLERDMREKKLQVNLLQEQVEERDAKVEELEDIVEEKEKSLKKLQLEFDELQQEVHSMKGKMDSLSNSNFFEKVGEQSLQKNRHVEQVVKEKSEIIQNLQNELSDAKRALEKAKTSETFFKSEVETKSAIIDKKAKELKAVQQESEVTQVKLHKMQKEFLSLQNQKELLEHEMEKIKETGFQGQNLENMSLQTKIKDLSDKNQKLRNKLEDWEKEYNFYNRALNILLTLLKFKNKEIEYYKSKEISGLDNFKERMEQLKEDEKKLLGKLDSCIKEVKDNPRVSAIFGLQPNNPTIMVGEKLRSPNEDDVEEESGESDGSEEEDEEGSSDEEEGESSEEEEETKKK